MHSNHSTRFNADLLLAMDKKELFTNDTILINNLNHWLDKNKTSYAILNPHNVTLGTLQFVI